MTFSKAVVCPADQVDPTRIGSPMQLVDISLIQEGQRIRTLSGDQVERLKASITDVGLLNPITVYRCSITKDDEAVDGFGVVAGAHRLAACLDLGHAEIPVVILEMEEPQRIIAECDENLCSTVLTPSERAEFTHRRKAAYEQLHPEAKHGGDRRTDQGANLTTRSFADETAAATGKSARAVRRDAERGANIAPDVFATVKGTKLNTGTYLDQLKRLSLDEQKQRVQADLDKLRQDAEASNTSKTARNANQSGRKRKNSHPGPCPTADRPGRFAALLEELAGYERADFERWLTMGADCRRSIKKAGQYARSATAVIRWFQEAALRQRGGNGTSETSGLGRRFLAASQVYVEVLQEASDAPDNTDLLGDLNEEELATLRGIRARIEEIDSKIPIGL
jgi:ParB family chromosome partitioning protein